MYYTHMVELLFCYATTSLLTWPFNGLFTQSFNRIDGTGTGNNFALEPGVKMAWWAICTESLPCITKFYIFWIPQLFLTTDSQFSYLYEMLHQHLCWRSSYILQNSNMITTATYKKYKKYHYPWNWFVWRKKLLKIHK